MPLNPKTDKLKTDKLLLLPDILTQKGGLCLTVRDRVRRLPEMPGGAPVIALTTPWFNDQFIHDNCFYKEIAIVESDIGWPNLVKR